MSLVNTSTVIDIMSRAGDPLQAIGAVTVVLLGVLMSQREILRAMGDSRYRAAERALDAVIVPLLPVAALIIAARLIGFIIP